MDVYTMRTFEHFMSGGAHAKEGLTDSSLELNDVVNIPRVDGNFTLTSTILQEDHCDDNEQL